MAIAQPATRPANPRFSSGPCAKPPTFELSKLADAALGRSHRAAVGKAKLKDAIEGTREVLGIPADYKIGIVPASDTGAVEMALWSLLGARKVEMLAWESFGSGWVTDVVKQLKIDAEVKTADYGQIVDLASVDFANDVVFTWNGTTAGVRVPNGDWIADDRDGLTICDATSAAFAMDPEAWYVFANDGTKAWSFNTYDRSLGRRQKPTTVREHSFEDQATADKRRKRLEANGYARFEVAV